MINIPIQPIELVGSYWVVAVVFLASLLFLCQHLVFSVVITWILGMVVLSYQHRQYHINV